jgi:hypothetical protein
MDEQEATLAWMIHEEFILPQRYCQPSTVRCLALTIYHNATGEVPDRLDDESVDDPLIEDDLDAPFSDDERTFIASCRWMARFLRQFNLSLRTPHSQRRPTIDPETIKEVNVRICDLFRLYEP